LKDTNYYQQVELLLKILPLVAAEKVFALKGGTAINFFIRDLPRLSVDIDLAFIPINERYEAFLFDSILPIYSQIPKSLSVLLARSAFLILCKLIVLKAVHGELEVFVFQSSYELVLKYFFSLLLFLAMYPGSNHGGRVE